MKKPMKKIVDERMVYLLFASCWAVYFTSYIGRFNLSSAQPKMISSGVFSESEAGLLSMIFFFCYAFGQLINGIVADKVMPRKMIFWGLTLSAAANLSMGLCPVGFMYICWGINGYTQAMIWPPIIRIFGNMLESQARLKCCIHITTSSVVGNLVCYLLSALMLFLFNWQSVFWAASLLLFIMAVAWRIIFKRVDDYADRYGIETELTPISKKAKMSSPILKILISSGLAVLLVPIIVYGFLREGITIWVPTYLTKNFSVTDVTSVLMTSVLPVINLSGAYAANFVYKKLQNETKSCAVFFVIALICLLLLLFLGNLNMILALVLIAIITSAMLAIGTLFINVLPTRFEKVGLVGTVSGFLNCSAYMGSAVATFLVGLIAGMFGWNWVIITWTSAGLLATVCCILARNFKVRNKYEEESQMKEKTEECSE